MGARGDDLTPGRLRRHRHQHQPARSEVSGARRRRRSTSSCRTRSSATPTCRCRSRRRRRSRAPGLLLPHPQYGQINARQVTEGYNRYNAGVIEFTRRLTNGFGGRFNYTYSVLKDNQFGETNFYSSRQPGAGREQLQLHRVHASVRGRSAVHDRLLRSQRRVRLRHPRRAAPPQHRADLRAAVRNRQEVGAEPGRRSASSADGWSPRR